MAPNHDLPLDTMNQTADPRQDFSDFAWGKWIAKNPIPDEYASWGIFHKLRDEVLANLRTLCDELAGQEETLQVGTPSAHVAQFWKTAMDEAGVEKQGATAIVPLFARIDAVESVEAFIETAAFLHTRGIENLFSVAVEPDLKQSDIMRFFVAQGGLGLPDRDYYTEADKAPLLQAYREHILKVWNLYHGDNASGENIATEIVELETKLAVVSRTRTAMRDIQSLYNKRSEADLRAAPFSWESAFRGYNLPIPEFLIEATPEFFTFLVENLTVEALPRYKQYVKWQILRQLSPYLPAVYVQADFELSQKLSGTKELAPRWKRVVGTLNSVCGELMGKVYCEKFFSSEAKTAMLELVNYLKLALREKIGQLEWMTPSTKERSLEKLEAFRAKIGYPDQWLDLSTIHLSGTYADMVLELHRFNVSDMFSRANKAPETWRWEMPPQVVNAYYHPMFNEIVFPAAILQHPAYSLDRDIAMNFGAIGAVIGHEMTHGFDDQGRLFDYKGNMIEWWTPEDVTAFNERTKVVVEQFNGYTVLGKNVNGQMTLGENIADIGGLKIAYRAMELYFADHPNAKPGLIDGFTPEQRFFLSWSQFWATNTRDEQAIKLLSIDVHSPGHLRSFVPLKNLPEFHAAFNVKETDGMYLPDEQRAAVW
ncbi:unnamed protein product [Aphanomyces euteiches]|uniref:Peptidase M13 N-terminal domain-containing protein n=1 Tax=Aphanomyces euteiches TaxID=100861 RepID=A0A6G0XJD3_9STRA|nr:hypothetical protein Ae201684_004158 [Aphanomyces euteiches]